MKLIRLAVAIPLFVGYVAWEFILANLSVAYAIWFVSPDALRQRRIRYDVTELSHFETLLLAQLITLTPGTITAAISESGNELDIHALNCDDPDELRKTIRSGLHAAVLKVTRL